MWIRVVFEEMIGHQVRRWSTEQVTWKRAIASNGIEEQRRRKEMKRAALIGVEDDERDQVMID